MDADVATITRDELKQWMDTGRSFTLVEVLPAFQYRQAHLPGAVNIPPGEVRARAPQLVPDKDADIVVYCGAYT
jgi:rhodanese-related sulfurtransferase